MLKIQNAKVQLSVSNKNIKEIAIELGFEPIDYFSTSFKKTNPNDPRANSEIREKEIQGKRKLKNLSLRAIEFRMKLIFSSGNSN